MVPLLGFLNVEQLLNIGDIPTRPKGASFTLSELVIALFKNFSTAPRRPRVSRSYHLVKQFLSQTGNPRQAGGRVRATPTTSGGVLFVAGMWFQDLWNYDFPVAPRCTSSPTAPRRAKSASAPTTPASAGGKIVEKMHDSIGRRLVQEKGRHRSTPRIKRSSSRRRARRARSCCLRRRCGSKRLRRKSGASRSPPVRAIPVGG